MLVSPAFTFSIILATLYGLILHLIVGGEWRLLVIYILSSWVGFGIGQGVGQVMHTTIVPIGQINVMLATLGAFIALAAAFILTRGRFTTQV